MSSLVSIAKVAGRRWAHLRSKALSTSISTPTPPFPTTARTVIIGGGAIGSSVAYHLAKLGRKDIVILEQGTVGCGTTWHAAGLVGQLRPTPSEIYLSCYGSQLYSELEMETGQATGFRRCGSLTLAQTDDRMIALKRSAARAKAFNIEAYMISPSEAGERLGGIIETSDLKGALWLPQDGTVSPSDLTASYIAGAKQNGVKLLEQTKLLGFEINDSLNQVTTVHTDRGDILCEEVVNCAGQWARNVGLMAGVTVPLHAAEHFYIVTQPFTSPGISKDMPLFRDPDSYTYFREWSGGLCAGGFEPKCKPCFPVMPNKNQQNEIPDKFEFQLFQEDWDHFSVLMEGALKRIPSLGTVGVRQMVNGPESFTADNQYILGEAPERRKFYVAAGFNSSGIASSGGAGKALAEWIVDDKPPLDLWTVDIRRFSQLQNNGRYLHDRTLETLGLHYQIQYPKKELMSSRDLRKSAIYDRLASFGAVFGSKFGWERPNYFSPTLAANRSLIAPENLTFQRPHWFEDSRAEHMACREAVALFDQSSFSKLLVKGHDAGAFLQRVCCNDMAGPTGRIVYTGLLNSTGGMESDCTVTKLASDEYLLVTSTAQAVRDMDWLNRCIFKHTETTGEREHVMVVDMSSAYAVFSLMGPRARDVLQRLSTEDLSSEAFPFGTSKLIDLGQATVRASRITYVGELGYELYIPTEMAVSCYQALMQAGEASGIRNAGYYAIDSLRMEKGYRAWGHELSTDWTPYDCGLAFAVKLSKKENFIGKQALMNIKTMRQDTVPTRQLVCFSIEDPSVFPWGSESILYDGDAVGYVTSAAYGHTVGRGVVFAMIQGAHCVQKVKELSALATNGITGGSANSAASTGFEIEVNGTLFPVVPHGRPLYDPEGYKIKA